MGDYDAYVPSLVGKELNHKLNKVNHGQRICTTKCSDLDLMVETHKLSRLEISMHTGSSLCTHHHMHAHKNFGCPCLDLNWVRSHLAKTGLDHFLYHS